ncbi:MAG: DNA primase [Acidobacteria bacterium]|nr:DNA primase [Acidobacteriota bacterium]
MIFPDAFLQEVRNTANIVSLVSEYVRLRKRGRNHVGLCPFHSEKTPSFNVNDDKQIFHCFGCGVGGDAFKFLMLMERLEFPEAVRRLAEKNGIPLPKSEPAPGAGVKEKILAALEDAARFFQQCLRSDEGRMAREYLEERQISPETVEKFRLGYAPSSGVRLIQVLQGSGYSLSVLEQGGLLRRSDSGEGILDKFRNRVMFPIFDLSNRVVAFGGRILGEGLPKYLNSPESPVFTKGHHLYGLNLSKEAIRRADFAILVEGYFDLLVPYQHGTTNVVASLGTSLTPPQVKLLGRHTRNILVNFDPDAAGLSATQRSLDLFLEEGFRVNVVRLPQGRDPDSFVRDFGIGKYREELRNSVPYLDFVLEKAIRAERTPASPRAKVNVLNAVLPYLSKLENRVERAEYVTRLSRKLEIEDQLVLAEVRKAVAARKTNISADRLLTDIDVKPAERHLIKILLEDQDIRLKTLPLLSDMSFEGLRTRAIFCGIMDLYNAGKGVDYFRLKEILGDSEEGLLLERILLQEGAISISPELAGSCVRALRKIQLENASNRVQEKIRLAEASRDEISLVQLLEEKRDLNRQLLELERT